MNKAPTETAVTDGKEISEDTAYLTEQLHIIETACKNYDDRAAFAAFDRLKEKTWKPNTAAAIEEIRDMLFLDSNFAKAAELAGLFHGQ